MHLTDEDIKAFQAVWERAFGEAITIETARGCAHRLIELYVLMTKLGARGDHSQQKR